MTTPPDPHRFAKRSGTLLATLESVLTAVEIFALPHVPPGSDRETLERRLAAASATIKRLHDEDEAASAAMAAQLAAARYFADKLKTP